MTEILRRTKVAVENLEDKPTSTLSKKFGKSSNKVTLNAEYRAINSSPVSGKRSTAKSKTQSNDDSKEVDLVMRRCVLKNQQFRDKYVQLSTFIKGYKSKLLLNKQVTDALDDNIITAEHLNKIKANYSD